VEEIEDIANIPEKEEKARTGFLVLSGNSDLKFGLLAV
jgi:hypothetical protein